MKAYRFECYDSESQTQTTVEFNTESDTKVGGMCTFAENLEL